MAAPTPAQAQIPAAGQQQPQAQPAQQQAPLVLQVDGTGDTSSEEDEDEEEDYDDDEEEDKEKDGAEDGQVEEVSFYKSLEKKRRSPFTIVFGAKQTNYTLFFQREREVGACTVDCTIIRLSVFGSIDYFGGLCSGAPAFLFMDMNLPT